MRSVGEIITSARAMSTWPTSYFLGTGLGAAAFLCIVNSRWAALVGFSDTPQWMRAVVTVVAVLTLCIAGVKGWRRWLAQRMAQAATEQRGREMETDLRNLTPMECVVILSFLRNHERVRVFVRDTEPGRAAEGLVERNHLLRVAMRHDGWAFHVMYMIVGPVWDFFRQYPELLNSGLSISSDSNGNRYFHLMASSL